jgi:uncharacterized membrane protein YoaK (UPF0700 family)
MTQTKVNVALMSWLLSFVAGYADTTTFICANRLFSAHVTGNFVVFVYSILTNPHSSVWLNLLSFPFFIAAIAVSSSIVRYSKYPGNVLRTEAVLLLMAGAIAAISQLAGIENTLFIFLLAMMIVFAMGLQNGFGKLYPYTTYSATTIMTGNLTQFTLDLMTSRTSPNEATQSLRKQGLIISSFFAGCLSGGILSHFIGLPAIILPGLIMLYFWKARKKLILINENRYEVQQA